MTQAPNFVDVSGYQPTVGWADYHAWASQWDGVSRVAMKSSEGVGYTDPAFVAHRTGALATGINVILYYHYGRPSLNNATTEADYQHSVVGDVRPQDVIVLNLEEGSAQANAEWAYEWLARQEANYGGKLPAIYASDAYILARLQDARLARYPLYLADWQFTPDARPTCPKPWAAYTYLQYTDRATQVPGIAGTVDADIFLGVEGVTDLITINSPDIADHFTQLDANHWQCKYAWDAAQGIMVPATAQLPGKVVAYGMLANYQATNGFVTLRLPTSNEVPIENIHPTFAHLAGKSIVVQYFQAGILIYDPQHLVDAQEGAGDVYRLQLYATGSAGTDPRLWVLMASIAQLQQQLQAEQQKVTPPDPVTASEAAKFVQIKQIVNAA